MKADQIAMHEHPSGVWLGTSSLGRHYTVYGWLTADCRRETVDRGRSNYIEF